MSRVECTSVELDNFKSFIGHHEIKMDRLPGVYFMDGENRVDPDLGSNGAGKSNIVDAICFVLTGKTSRGLKASNVHSWEAERKSTLVTLHLTVNGKEHELLRSWNPNNLLIDGKESDQEEVNDLVGLSPNEIDHTLTVSQTASLFFDLRKSDKLKLFSDALDLDVWLELSDEAKEESDKLVREVDSLDRDIESTENVIAEQKEQAEEYLDRADSFEEERTERIEAREENVEEMNKTIKTLTKEEKSLKKELEEATKALSNAEELLTSIQSEVEEKQNAKNSLSEKRGKLSAQQENALDRLDKFSSDDIKPGGTCPHCEQKISKAHVEREKKAAEEEYDEVCDEIERLEEDMDSVEEEIELKTKEEKEAKRVVREQRDKERNADMSLMDTKQRKDTLHADIENEEETIVTISKESNPYDEMAEGLSEKIKANQKNLKQWKKKRKNTSSLQKGYEYWIKGFKDVRLSVVQSALTELEVETNNHLIQLGMPDWTIKYDVEKENKTGGISKGFNVLIHSPNNKEPVPWEAWSGGETQRLRLAGAFGLSSLIQSHKGISTNIEFIDEQTNGLGGSGVDDLIERLIDRAEQLDKSIYFIDHRSHDQGWFSGTLNVIKTQDGSFVEEIE